MEYLQELKNNAKQNHIPIIKDDGCDFLIDFCKKIKPKKILEIGTAVGYSGSQMLLCSQDSQLDTIEINEQNYQMALKTFQTLNLQQRANCILGDAKEVIQKLDGDYDLIFLDGPKGQYINYYETLKKLLKSGGCIFADNIYFHGLVLGEEFVKHKLRTIVVNLRKFIEIIKNDKQVEVQFFNISDGIAIIKKK